MLREEDFDELRIQAQGAAETGGTVFEADPAVILALFERFDADTTTAQEGVEIVADLRAQLRVTTAALRSACHDGWADGDSAMARYLRVADETAGTGSPVGADQEAQADDEGDEGLLEHGWRLRQDDPLPEGALEVIENLASVGADCGAGTVHAAALDEDDRALSTYGVLLDDGITVGVAVDCEAGVIRWASRAPERT